MKRPIFIILLISIIQIVNGQEFKYLKPNLGDSCSIIKTKIDSINFYEQIIYIDYKVNSELKERVADFRLTEDRLREISLTYAEIETYYKVKEPKVNHQLPNKWIKLNKYKGEWILYDDIEFNTRYILTDSSLVNFNMDGLCSNMIKDHKSKGKNFQFTLLDQNLDKPESISEYVLNIRIVDENNIISVWQFIRDGRKSYSLMIPESKKINFPVMGVMTTDLMGDESEILDEIDFDKLIKN